MKIKKVVFILQMSEELSQEMKDIADLHSMIVAFTMLREAREQIAAMKTHQLQHKLPKSKATSKQEELQCKICQNNFIVDEEITWLPCFHPFHSGCIKPWFNQNSTCPTCRTDCYTENI
jgi:hypothetical protein